MNTNMNGKEIKEVWWPDNEREQGRHIKSDNLKSISLSATDLGDHDEIWIVEKRILTGEETARHNPRFVETIVWA